MRIKQGEKMPPPHATTQWCAGGNGRFISDHVGPILTGCGSGSGCDSGSLDSWRSNPGPDPDVIPDLLIHGSGSGSGSGESGSLDSRSGFGFGSGLDLIEATLRISGFAEVHSGSGSGFRSGCESVSLDSRRSYPDPDVNPDLLIHGGPIRILILIRM